jgi:acetyl-CoA carboxylase carboxyl transferase subunit alpha
VIDVIVDEPVGGAHRHPQEAAKALGDALATQLNILTGMTGDALKMSREQRFLAIGREGLV